MQRDLGRALQHAAEGHDGGYAGARPLYEGSPAIREKVLGADHPLTAASLNNLALCCRPWAITHRHYQAGLAEFGQGKFEDAVRSIEKMNLESPDPRAKFYALQVVVSAYGHLGRTDQAAAALERFRKVVVWRQEYEPSQLLTQDYMVFKNASDIERVLAGLTMAGVPDLPVTSRRRQQKPRRIFRQWHRPRQRCRASGDHLAVVQRTNRGSNHEAQIGETADVRTWKARRSASQADCAA